MSREHKKFERLFLFSQVAKHLSFTEASLELGISRGYLSEQVKQLEVELGQALLVRTTRNVKLTPQGETVLSSMVQVKQSLLELERNIRHETTNIAGQLRITAPSQFIQRYLVHICEEFQQLYPDIKIIIDCSYTLFNLSQNNFDLAFRSTKKPPLNMVAKKLFDYKHVCCASTTYLQKFGLPTSIEQLKDHQCLTSSEQSTWLFNQQEVTVPHHLCINNNHLLKELAIENQGIILVSEYLVDRDIKKGRLQQILSDQITLDSTVYLIHPQLISQSARLSYFIQFTINWFKKNLEN
jgi:DNA-binding transcriptional LysR family regulator